MDNYMLRSECKKCKEEDINFGQLIPDGMRKIKMFNERYKIEGILIKNVNNQIIYIFNKFYKYIF